MQKIIELRNVTAYRGDSRVFDGLSLELVQCRNTVILGPNGAGKTTLLKLISREIYPVHGDDSYMRIFGEEHWNVWELRSHLGIVSHDLQREYTAYTKGLNVILSGYYSSVNIWSHQTFSEDEMQRAEKIMAELGIVELKLKLFAEMSTGEQRRFLLGRALVNDPDALILDEPTSGLDVRACFHYLDIIRALMQKGKTLILVTHHIHEIPPEVSHVVLLKGGRILAQGEKSKILTSDNLGRLFDVPIELLQANGFYQVMPG